MNKQLQRFLLAICLIIFGGATSVWGQSTYSFTAGDWKNDNRGNVTVNSDTLRVDKVKNHLVGIKNTKSYKIPYRQTYVVVKGHGFKKGESGQTDPNIIINNNGTKVKVLQETTDTCLVFDITDQLPTQTDFFGNVEIKQINLIIKTSKGDDDKETQLESDYPGIKKIDIYQPDFIDLGEITFSKNNTCSDYEKKTNKDGYSKYIKFKQTSSDGDFGIKFSFDTKVNNSDMYFVLESNIDDKDKLKVRNLKIGGTDYENNTVACSKVFTVNDHKVVIASPLGTGTDGANGMYQYYQDNTIVPITNCQLYVKNEKDKEVEIYRAGMYNLAEILQLYPSIKTSNDWQLVYAERPRIETNGTNGTTVKLKGGTDNVSCNIKQFTSLIRSLGNMPSEYTTFNLHATTTLTEDESNVPHKVDILSEFTNNPTFMFHPTFYKYFPTMSQKVKISNGNYKYYQYKDGVEPATVETNATSDGGGSTTIATFTRKFVVGYSSCVLPFNVTTADLPKGLSAYTFGSCSESGNVIFSPAGETITAGTPFVIKATEAGLYLIPSASTVNLLTTPDSYYSTTASNNVKFVGSFVNEVPSGDYASTTNFGITVDGRSFAKMNATTTKTTYYRAFLADNRTTSGAKAYVPAFVDDETTDIDNINSGNTVRTRAEGIYTIDGRRVSNGSLTNAMLPKGIYIVNGKKVVIK